LASWWNRNVEAKASDKRIQSHGLKGRVNDAENMVGKMQRSATVERLAEQLLANILANREMMPIEAFITTKGNRARTALSLATSNC
jgi:hypothetical protein